MPASTKRVFWKSNTTPANALRSLVKATVSSNAFCADACAPTAIDSPIGDRHAHVVEEQFGRVGRFLPDLVELAAAPKALAFRLDQDDRHAAPRGLGVGIGLGDHQHQIGVLPVGNIGLAAVEDVVVAVALRGGAD
ncbi:hypothetical protein WR25_13963 [Diploscapter pachys]|uniref:Uncharacterized protein n=1 Tax=Diploscapter pachys TaxID=2018661 RepID=A0A2A2JYX8_9BILA|nr:hypothetical protein WR25_13963 [Diploscapter pachys]